MVVVGSSCQASAFSRNHDWTSLIKIAECGDRRFEHQHHVYYNTTAIPYIRGTISRAYSHNHEEIWDFFGESRLVSENLFRDVLW